MTLDHRARARDLALRAHTEQRYGEHPYRVHLEAVQSVLSRFGIEDETVRAAAWVHDVLEDATGTSRADLERLFPEATVAIVDACTDGAGSTREERKRRSLQLIPRTHNAILVKLADRIANVEASIEGTHDGKLAMYRDEHRAFANALRASPSDPSAIPMWQHLDELLS